ncbi:MAG: hypothetical protein HC837_05900 [Chloroflexaceae bacterium]|nr:hypothetical protein [Chloroflexaceae bacterium]
MNSYSAESNTNTADFMFLGGHPCLDFVNTEMMVQEQRTDLLTNPERLLEWLETTSLVTAETANWVRQGWLDDGSGALVLEQARTLRQMLRTMFDQIIDGTTVDPAIITAINAYLAVQALQLNLVQHAHDFDAEWVLMPREPQHILASIAAITVDLLTAGEQRRIKRCENPSCIRYFYDTTRNHSRRWCSMEQCGNRMKVAAYYRRKRPQQKGSD